VTLTFSYDWKGI